MLTAIVSLYNPDNSVVSNCEAISSQVCRVILCDNSSTDNKDLFAHIDNALYVANLENKGISAAFNSVLLDGKFNWSPEDLVVFFDQDSRITDNYMRQLEKAFLNIEQSDCRMGCMGPFINNASSNSVEAPRVRGFLQEGFYKTSTIITSSMITRYSSLQQAGYWDEAIFLDYADWALCWRMRARGMICVMTSRILLDHAVGNENKHIGPLNVRVWPPIREYYQVRDALKLVGVECAPFRARVRLAGRAIVGPLFRAFVLDNGLNRLKYSIDGFRDFFLGERGCYPQ